MKRLMLSLIVVALLAFPATATEFWITADASGAHGDATVQLGASFELYAFVDPTTDGVGIELDYLEMWTGLADSGIAEFTGVTIIPGVPMASAIFPEEALYGATEMAMATAGHFATLEFNAIGPGETSTISFPIKSNPGGITFGPEAKINVVPEPTTITMALVGLIGFCLFATRRR